MVKKLWPLSFLIPPLWFVIHFVQDRWVYSKDTVDFFYVVKRWVWLRIWEGEIPLWNDGLYTGFYQMASPALAVFAPNNVLFLNVFSGFEAEQLQLPTFSLLAAIGMFLLARNFVDRGAAVFLGLSYGLSGPLLSLADRSHIFYAVALYPWFFYFSYRFTKDRKILDGLGVSMVLAIIVAHGDWVTAPLLTKLAGIYWVRENGVKKSHWQFFWPHVLTWGLVAVSVLPAFDNLSESTRAGGFTLTETSYYSFHPMRLFNLALPELFGQAYDGTFWGQNYANAYEAERFWFHSLFLGSGILVFGFLGLLALPRKARIAVLACVVFLIVLAAGVYVGLHELFYQVVGPYRSLRYPEKFVLYPILALFGLAIWGLRNFREENWRIVAGAIAILNLIAFTATFFYPGENFWSARFIHLAVLSAAVAIFYLRAWRMPILTGIACLELFAFAPAMFWYPGSSFREASPLAQDIPKGARFVRDGLLDLKANELVRRRFLPDWHLLDGVSEVFGYETLQPPRIVGIKGAEIFRNFAVWSRVLNLNHVVTSISPREKNLKEMAELGHIEVVKMDQPANTVLVRAKEERSPVEVFNEIQIVDGENAARDAVIERGSRKEPAIVEGLTSQLRSVGMTQWSLTEKTRQERTYEVKADAEAFFVEREAFHPNWVATIDGIETPIYRADLLSRGVIVPAGDHILKFEFRAPRFWLAAVISSASVLIYLALLAFALLRKAPSRS